MVGRKSAVQGSSTYPPTHKLAKQIVKHSNMMKILLADDHAAIRTGLKYLLRRAFPDVIVLEACNYAEARSLAHLHHDLDLIIMDLTMPGNNAGDGVANMCAQLPATAIIVFSASDDPQDIAKATAAGAYAYLHKSASNEEMVAVVRRSLEHSGLIHSGVTDDALSTKTSKPKLTPRQQEVLELLVQGMTNKQIARVLQISDMTVKTHVTTILQLLCATNRTEAARHAVRDGHLPMDG